MTRPAGEWEESVRSAGGELSAERPDHEDVEGDEDEGPQRVVGQPREVRKDAEAGHSDAGDLAPGLAGQDPQGHGDGDGSHHDVDPAPRREVELVGVLYAPD